MPSYTSAFLVWNPFQYNQFESLVEHLKDSKVVVVDRKGNLTEFDRDFLHRRDVEIIPVSETSKLDGRFDLIFFQAPFPYIETFRKSKLVSVQYGLAKERHNYGEWRSLADMNLMFGPYSEAITSHYSPSYAIGNLRFSRWDFVSAKQDRVSIAAGLNIPVDRENVLYMPTYGQLSSFSDVVPLLAQMTDRYNVIVKIHHNDDRKRQSLEQAARQAGLRHFMSNEVDQLKLLAIADLVVSDFSGAIFDAVYARVPVLLFQARASEVKGIQKFSEESIERRLGAQLGLVCDNAADLPGLVDHALKNRQDLVNRVSSLRDDLFVDSTRHDTLALAEGKIGNLITGKIPPLTFAQGCVRETVRALIASRRMMRKGPIGRRAARMLAGLKALLPTFR